MGNCSERVTATAADGSRLGGDLVRGGDPDATPVLLLAGQSLGPEIFDDFRDHLGRSTFAISTRGTGASRAALDADWTTAGFAADAVRLLDAAGLDRVDVVGFSMGGRVAQALAAAPDARVRRLVLAATGPGGSVEVPRGADADDALLAAAAEPERARDVLTGLFFSPAFTAAHPDLAARFAPQGSPRSRRRHHSASRRHDGGAALATIRARGIPTLVLHGAADPLTPPRNAEVIATALGTRAVLIPAARHGCLHEPEGAAVDLVREFLDRGVSP